MEMIAPPAPNDPGQYLLDVTPGYIASLVKLRAELAARQGAMTAVEATARLRREAEFALEAAREQAEQLLADAAERLAKAKKAEADVKAKGRDLDSERTAFEAQSAAAQKAIAEKMAANTAKAEELSALELRLEMQAAELATAQADLADRTRLLQSKVAALAL